MSSEITISGTSGGLRFETSQWAVRFDGGGGSLPLKLGARFCFLNNSEFSLTWQLVLNALSLLGLNIRAGLANLPYCARCCSDLEETTEYSFYYCKRVRLFRDHVEKWKARIERWLRHRQRSASVSGWEASWVSCDPSQNADLDDVKKGIEWRCKLVIGFCSLGISLGWRSNAIENAWIT